MWKLIWNAIKPNNINYTVIFQEVFVSIIVSVLVWVIMQPFKKNEESLVVTQLVNTQHKLDSILYREQLLKKEQTVDSLSGLIKQQHEKDSIRSNAKLSKLDAIRAINNYLKSDDR